MRHVELSLRRGVLLPVAVVLSAAAGRAQAMCIEGTQMACTVSGISGQRVCESGEWSECIGPDGLPIPPVEPIKRPSWIGRTGTTVTLRNDNTQAGPWKLQHQAGSTWTNLATVALGGTYVHSGLLPDSRHCYRFSKPGGTTIATCDYTTDGTGRTLWRAQIELTTADVADAGTDDRVSVRLSDDNTNFTWLDYGRDDFERKTKYTYDLRIDYVPLLSDANSIKIQKYGTNGWCLSSFRLLLNGVEAYTQSFASQPGGCLWLDNDDGHLPSHSVSHPTLRSHPKWQGFVQPARFLLTPGTPPQITATLTIPQAEIESRVESLFGDGMQFTPAGWGGLHGPRHVEATASTEPGSVHFDLDLEADLDNDVIPDTDVDLDFDLRFQPQCSSDGSRAEVVLTAANVVPNAYLDWWLQVLGLITGCGGCVDAIEHFIEDHFRKAFESIALPQSSASLPGFRCLDAGVEVSPNGTTRLRFLIEPS